MEAAEAAEAPTDTWFNVIQDGADFLRRARSLWRDTTPHRVLSGPGIARLGHRRRRAGPRTELLISNPGDDRGEIRDVRPDGYYDRYPKLDAKVVLRPDTPRPATIIYTAALAVVAMKVVDPRTGCEAVVATRNSLAQEPRMNVHKHARMTVHGRYLVVCRVRQEGWRVRDAAVAAGISPRTATKWLARYRAGGMAALRDRGSAPRRGFSRSRCRPSRRGSLTAARFSSAAAQVAPPLRDAPVSATGASGSADGRALSTAIPLGADLRPGRAAEKIYRRPSRPRTRSRRSTTIRCPRARQ